jgi:hypothetical protein
MKAALLLATFVLAPPHVVPPAPRTPVLVELFTSEGCSSCPSADALLAKLLREQPVADAEIIPLALHVDYWNRDGWKDPYSAKAFSQRQQAYSGVSGDARVYTPQLVIDGREAIVGSDEIGARRAVESAAARGHLPLTIDARLAGTGVRLSIDLPAAPAGAEPVDVMVALTEHDLRTAVTRGENAGRTLTHAAVVRTLQTLGALEAESFVANGQIELNRTWKASSMRAVVWLQGRTSRHVLGAAAVPLAR